MTPAVYLVLLLWLGDSSGTVSIPQASMQACETERYRIHKTPTGQRPSISSVCVEGVRK